MKRTIFVLVGTILVLAAFVLGASAAAQETCSTTVGGAACSGPIGTLCTNLSFTPGVGSVGTNVYRGTTSGGESSTPLNSTPLATTVTTYQDAAIPSGATNLYYLVVDVLSDGIIGPAAPEVCVTFPTATAPTGVSANPK